jgi:hypothetical protein
VYQGPATGLYSSPNPFTAAPAGSLAVADNVRYSAPQVLEPRPGNAPLASSSFGSGSSLIDAMVLYGTELLAAYDLTKVSRRPDGGPFTDFSGTFVPVGANRMRFELAARSIFFNTTTGLWVWDGTGQSSQPVPAGNPQGLNILATNASANGWQPANTAVAYRFTICSKDAFGRIVEGPPSGRTVLRNKIQSVYPTDGVTRSGGTTVHVTTDLPHGLSVGDVVVLSPGEANFPAGAKTVTAVPNSVQFDYAEAGANVSATVTLNWEITRSAALTAYLPVDPSGNPATTSNFLRFYRSDETEDALDVPEDELFLCYESPYLTATNISNGYFSFNDVTPTSAIEIPLYTNPNTGDGSLAANYQPPKALDHAYFANRMWFLNTSQKHSAPLALLGVGSPDGLQDGDTLTFIPDGGTIADNVTFTAKSSPSVVGEFQLYDDGDADYNIQRTAQALCQAINDYPSFAAPPVYAYYVSAEGGVPGKMLFVARAFPDAATAISFANGFTLYSSRATAWNPQLPTAVGPAYLVKSDDDAHAAGLSYSKLGQPEAVPLTNRLRVDADNNPGIRCVPLHYRLIIFKSDGIYFVTNTEPFTVQKMSSFVLLAPDSVALLDERLFCLTDQGIVAISDAGVEPISVPIDDVLVALGGPDSLTALKGRSVGVAYRTARQYILWVPERNNDGTFSTDTAQAFVYSTLSGGFTRYTFGARAALIDTNSDQLVLAPTDANELLLENKTLTEFDYADELLAVTVVGKSSVSRVTLSDASEVEVGDVIEQAGARYLVVDVTGNVVTVLGVPGFDSGAATVYKAIECEVKFNPFTDGEPAVMKTGNQVSFLWRRTDVRTAIATFASEIAPAPPADAEDVELTNEGWGYFGWGDVPWGGPPLALQRVEPLPLEAENCCQLSVGFTTRQALAKFEFLGIDARQTGDTEVNDG